MNKYICRWKFNEYEGWDTSCNNIYVFIADGPKENDYKFCPGCGKKIEEVKEDE